MQRECRSEGVKADAFDCMGQGWAMGSTEFKGALMAEHQHALAEMAAGEADLAEVAARRVENAVDACLKRLGRSGEEALNQPKAAAWKVAIAAHLRAPASDLDGEESLARRQVAHGRSGWGESVCQRTTEGRTSRSGGAPAADYRH